MCFIKYGLGCDKMFWKSLKNLKKKSHLFWLLLNKCWNEHVFFFSKFVAFSQFLNFLHLWYFVKIELIKLPFFVSLCSVDLNRSGRWSKKVCFDVVSWSHTCDIDKVMIFGHYILWYKLEQHFRFDVIYCLSTSQCTNPNLG